MKRLSLIFGDILPVRADRLLFSDRRSSSRVRAVGLLQGGAHSQEPYPTTDYDRRAHFRQSLARTLVASHLVGAGLVAIVAVVSLATS